MRKIYNKNTKICKLITIKSNKLNATFSFINIKEIKGRPDHFAFH